MLDRQSQDNSCRFEFVTPPTLCSIDSHKSSFDDKTRPELSWDCDSRRVVKSHKSSCDCDSRRVVKSHKSSCDCDSRRVVKSHKSSCDKTRRHKTKSHMSSCDCDSRRVVKFHTSSCDKTRQELLWDFARALVTVTLGVSWSLTRVLVTRQDKSSYETLSCDKELL